MREDINGGASSKVWIGPLDQSRAVSDKNFQFSLCEGEAAGHKRGGRRERDDRADRSQQKLDGTGPLPPWCRDLCRAPPGSMYQLLTVGWCPSP